MKTRTPLLFAGILALAAWSLSAQEPTGKKDPNPKTRNRFTDSTSVVVVEVPVNVIANGAPVRGLTAEDFRVFDGKKEQKLIGFEAIDLEALEGQAQPGTVPTPARRRFLLFFDFAFTPRNEIAKSIRAARQLVAGLHPSDVVALASFSRNRGAEILANFTNDRRQTNAVLDGLEQILDGKTPRASQQAQSAARGNTPDPLRMVVDRDATGALDVSATNIAAEALGETDGSGRAGAIYAETLGDMTAATQVRLTDRVRSLFKELSDSLSEFAAATASLDGRRFFVFFAHGFDGSIFDDPQAGLSAQGISRGGTSARNHLETAIGQFRRAGWEIHTVDPAITPSQGNFSQVDMLVSLARETGGDLYRNFGDLRTAMSEMLERTAVTYVLAFQVENVRQDGDFHPIKVEVRDKPGLRGVKVQHRSGYYSPRPNEQGITKVMTTAEKILSDDVGGDLQVDTLFVPFRGPSERTRVAAFLTSPGAELLEGASAEGDLGLEIFAYAIAENGDIEDFLAQQISLDAAKAQTGLKDGHFGMFFDLNLPPARYDLRVLFRQKGTGRYRLTGIPLQVPNLGGEPHLAGLTLFDDSGASLILREKAANADIPYPFVLGENQEFLPMTPARVDATSNQKRRLCLFGYGLRGGGLALDIALRSPSGQIVPDRVRLVGAAPTGTDGLDRLFLELDTSDLPVGDYQLEAALTKEQQQEKVGLVVQLR